MSCCGGLIVMHVKTIIHQLFPLQHWHALHPDCLIGVSARLVSKQCTKIQTKQRPSAHRLILAAFVRIRVPPVLDSESRDGCSGAAIHEPFLPCHNNKGEQIKSRSHQSAERKVGRTKPATHEFIKPFITGCFWCQKSWTQCFFFSQRLPLVSVFPSSSFSSSTSVALPHRRCCGPLGCLSTARSDFDICWNAQRSVQAWKDIQCFDPKPLVFFSSPSPFHQNLLCDIVHCYVGFQTTAWIYLNFHRWKTFCPSQHYCALTSRHDDDHAHTCRCAHAACLCMCAHGFHVPSAFALRCKSRHEHDMKTSRYEAAAVLHFRWGFNILWAHQRQHGWGESSGGQALQQENNYSTHHSGSTGGVRT